LQVRIATFAVSKTHCAIVLSRAYAYWLAIWNLNYSPRGQVVGASYTDVHAQLPAYRILIIISVATAVVLLLNIRYRGWRLPLLAIGVWVGVSILVGGIYPALVQQFRVTPNEAALEAPYIARNLPMTPGSFRPSGMKARRAKGPARPRRTIRCAPVAVSYSRMVDSQGTARAITRACRSTSPPRSR